MTGEELISLFLDELREGVGNKSVMIMIAGPNGAGKTTLWRKLIEPMLGSVAEIQYINASEIERELNAQASTPEGGDAAQEARHEAARRREILLSAVDGTQSHFAFETAFSDPDGHKLAELQRGSDQGYYVVMLFVGLESLEMAALRVAQRASTGGHDVPLDVQRVRFPRVFANAKTALQAVPLAVFFDNSKSSGADECSHRPVAVSKGGTILGRHKRMPSWWNLIEASTKPLSAFTESRPS